MSEKVRKIPPGYKRTEIGIIPEDWEVKKLGEVGQFKKGKGISKEDIKNRGVGSIRYGELYTHYNEIITSVISRIDYHTAQKSTRLSKGDVLFTGSGETKEEIGKSSTLWVDEEVYAGGDVIILTPNNKTSYPIFLGYLLNSNFIQKQKSMQAQGDAVVHIYIDNLKNIQIPLPPIPEQRAIARVLSDFDELIESLDKLIEKKKAIKKGAMQELLTGKKRLPGFSGKWVRKKLGEIANIKKGDLITEKEAKSGNIPVIGGGIEPTYYHNKPNRKPNTITISASGANAGYVNFHKYPIFASDCSTIEESSKYVIEFLYFSLKLFQNIITNLQTGGAQPHVYPEQLKQLEILLPPTLEEQRAIAQILSDMDEEIEALEKKEEKYKMLKKGAMELLLTGKVRLKGSNFKKGGNNYETKESNDSQV